VEELRFVPNILIPPAKVKKNAEFFEFEGMHGGDLIFFLRRIFR